MVREFSRHIQYPTLLFKYRDWDNENHRRFITHQEIFLAKASTFNDPFDGNIPVRWDLMTYEDCLQKNYDILHIAYPKADTKKKMDEAKKITDSKKMWHPDNLKKETLEKIKKWDDVMGLMSLSEKDSNILMWSHYSALHTGFVVGLNVDSLITDYGKYFDYLQPIEYVTNYPIISHEDDTTEQFRKKFFFKSELWKYEAEWRLSKNHIEKRVIRLHPETIRHVIIGCKATSETEKDIIKAVKKHLPSDTIIKKAYKHEEKFEIELKIL